jgi:diguanylate cyclase (GGDEF)-like protein/PAS domain S-box-containing protein
MSNESVQDHPDRDVLRILILEDHASDAELMELALKNEGLSFTSRRVETRETFEAALGGFHPDLILSDYTLPDYSGRAALEFAQKNFPDIPVIMVTGTVGEEAAVELLKAGAKDYVLKDRMARLPSAVERALSEVELAKVSHESERLLKESEARFRNALEHAPIGMVVATLDGRFIEVNQSICDLLGYTHEEFLTMTFMDITHPDDKEKTSDNVQKLLNGEIGSYKLEKRYLRKDGVPVWAQVTVSLLRDGSGAPLNFIGQIEDISERKRHQDEIRQLAYYDALTGLPNRRLLQNNLEQSLAQAKRHGRFLAVMFLDLDHFKEINDTLGHDAGDELLKGMTARLETCVRSGDTVARPGGDEFVIILPEISHQKDATFVAEKILKLLSEPITIHEREMKITASIGITVYPDDGAVDAMDLMRKADVAMYRAKEAGRDRIQFYSENETPPIAK